jgi:hypothetical protein
MTATRDFEHEWMQTSQTRKVFPVKQPKLGETYGDFENGTARRVYMPDITHRHQSHSSAAVAQALEWLEYALKPAKEFLGKYGRLAIGAEPEGFGQLTLS